METAWTLSPMFEDISVFEKKRRIRNVPHFLESNKNMPDICSIPWGEALGMPPGLGRQSNSP